MAVKMLGRSDANNAAASDLDALLVLATNADANATAALDAFPQTDGRTVDSLEDYLGNNAVFNFADYGAVGDGVADDAAAIAATITAAAGRPIVGKVGATYLIGSKITITGQIRADFRGSTIKLTGAFADSEAIFIDSASANKSSFIQDLIIDFNALTGVDGVRIQKADVFTFRRVRSKHTTAAGRYMFFCDNTSAERTLDILWDSCVSFRQLNGWRIVGMAAPQTTSFDSFTLLNCQHEGDGAAAPTGVSIYASGTGYNRVSLIGGDYESAGDVSLVADGVFVECGAYLESDTGRPFGRSVNGAHIHITAASNAQIGGVTGQASWKWEQDGTSTITVENRQDLPDGRLNYVAGPTDGARQFADSSDWIDSWGPPNYPLTKTGTVGEIGQQWRDMQGVLWTCTKAGTTVGPIFQRWCALDGTIIIPVDSTTLTNGLRLLNVQGDFEVESVELYVTTTFTGGTYYHFGTTTSVGQVFLSQEQCAVANLTAGATIRSIDNKRPTAVLNTPNGRHRIVGKEFGSVDDSNIAAFVSGVFNAGAGLLIVRGRYLIDPATGYPSFGVASAIAAAAYAPMQTVHFDIIEDATSTLYTCPVVLPAGATLHDIQIDQRALWAATGSAALKAGDTADDDGYFIAVDLKATDLLVGEQLRLVSSENWGGQQGAYLVAATGQRGPVTSNFGGFYAAGSTIAVIVNVVTPNAAPTGQTHVTVVYSLGGTGTVTKS